MDSLTHIVLGAAIGEAALGKKMGNRAMLWGGLISTIPDLDVFIAPFFNPVSALFLHRGFSHSLLFIMIMALAAGWLISKIEKKCLIELKAAIVFTFLLLLAHVLLDCFNTYGTGLFEPFSNVRISYDAIAIIDLVFLLPLLFTTIWAMFYQKQNRIRRILVLSGLVFSSIYFCYTVQNKRRIEQIAREQLSIQNVRFNRLLTTPLPLTNFIWKVVAEDENGYHMGFCSDFDKGGNVNYRFTPRGSELLGKLGETREVKELIRFTKGFYTVGKDQNGNLWLYDLRYGSLDFEHENAHVFSFRIMGTPDGVTISRSHPKRSISLKTIIEYFKRLF